MSDGAIIIRQLGYEGIAMDDVLRALPDEARTGDRVSVELDHRAVFKRAVETRDWAEAQRETLAAFDAHVAPPLQRHPNYGIHFFGTTSIPLMLLLGMKVSTWRSIVAYNHHHTRKDWTWDAPAAPAPNVSLDLDGLPVKASPASGDVVVRVSVSYAVDPLLTRAHVPQAIAEIDIGVDVPGLDILVSPAGVEAVAHRFREALDEIQKRLPNAHMVHVFAAVPPGVAFRMGAWISQNMHARIQSYEFGRRGATGGYYPAFILQQPAPPKLVPNTAEATTLERERVIWQEELEHLQALVASLNKDPKPWVEEVGAGSPDQVPPRWRSLPSPRSLQAIGEATVDVATREASDGFRFDAVSKTWQFGDSLLLPLLRRLPDETKRRRAARLFLLHESFHQEQLLTSGTSVGIGRFGKLLEEADYQADAWALLYDYRYERDTPRIDPPAFFRDAVTVAIETMMAFDDAEGVLSEMQARRISRYLIWTWQLLELERCASFDGCFAILCDKPLVELAGLRTHIADRRVISSLNPAEADDLELAVLRDGRIRRFARGPAARLDLVLGGLRQHKPEQIRAALGAIADVVIPVRKA